MAAADSGEERARFSCLTALRYTVAAVVTALAVVIIVMVIAAVVVLRPEKLSLSVVQGHVRTTKLYTESDTISHPAFCGGGNSQTTTTTEPRGGGGVGIIGGGRDRGLSAGSLASVSRPRRCPPQLSRTYGPVGFLDLGVVLSVENPSGRREITCESMEVQFYDNVTVGVPVKITSFIEPKFVVKPQSSHRFWKALRLWDKGVLAYIASQYGGSSGFMGKVNGTMTINGSTKKVDFECSPVDFSDDDDASDDDATVTCSVNAAIN
ncbi:unnamed protein product [Urochloa decumbens]|uniref:Late embryogenesis abundant protein LEA-2 subgroup domain-containing protein n=1 Tax=Urochloa decumbens TaxID=240449 RepID=A0ABC9E4S9_9POAL